MPSELKKLLTNYAERYETADFLLSDPSFFMHQVEGMANQEVTAFIASSLSYGRRELFMPKIQYIIDMADGDLYTWVANGLFKKDIPGKPDKCFYRLYTYSTMHAFLCVLQAMLNEYGSIGSFIKATATDGLTAVKAITGFFARHGIETIIPKNTSSACKRVCMFIRWMVRDNSPVDLGLWSSFIDKRTLIIPLDTHVLQEAYKLRLTASKTATMPSALKLSKRLKRFFPEDPLKGDFALFGYGVNH